MNKSRIIIHRGVPRIMPLYYIDRKGNKVNGKLSDELKESLVPFDLLYVTEYEKKIRENYIQVVAKHGEFLYKEKAIFKTLPEGLYVATADWLGDGKLVNFDTIEYAKQYYANIENLSYDRQAKMLKYISGPRCPYVSSIPDNIKITYKEGMDRLGTILVNPKIAQQIKIIERYPPYKETTLCVGAKIRGPFIKGTVVFSDETEGITFLEGSYKLLPEGPAESIKCGFWVESLPEKLCKNRVKISYTAYQHFANKLPESEKVNRFINGNFTRQELVDEFRFNAKGKLQTLKVIEMIREGVPINFGYPLRFLREKITDMIDSEVFNPVVKGIRATGVENNTTAKEVVIPAKYSYLFKIGETAILYRDPSSWIGAFQIVKVVGYGDDNVLKIPRRCAKAMEGDFDGDSYNLVPIDTLNKLFDVDIIAKLKSTPKLGHFPGKKVHIESGNDRNKLYNIALQIEMVKSAVGLLIHFRDNAWMRGILNQKGIEYIYHNLAQRALQSKNEGGKDNYDTFAFEMAAEFAKKLGIDQRKLVSKNETLNALRKKTLYPLYAPDKDSLFYNDIIKYTKFPFTEFNPRKTADYLARKLDIQKSHIGFAKRVIYKQSSIENLDKRLLYIRNECNRHYIDDKTIVVALLEMAVKRPMGEELIMARRLSKNIRKLTNCSMEIKL